jgi:hypothetical protein
MPQLSAAKALDMAALRQPHPARSLQRRGADTAQPLEPILFPKLRIHFADFPYLHCSIN